MKILTVLGARPQFVKASVVSAALSETARIVERVVHTGQHFDENMSGVFFEELGMRAPDVELGVHGGGHGAMTGRMLGALEQVILDEKPDAVLVYGDTNSTLAGALAAVKLHVPVAHVEAGLRSFNTRMPEEINRVVADRISRWLFAPTASAAEQLRAEGLAPSTIFDVGDVMFDVALAHAARAAERMPALHGSLGVRAGGFVLATIHRAENTDHHARLAAIVDGLAAVSREMPVVWPVHPRTRQSLSAAGLIPRASGIQLMEPQGYLSMVALEMTAAVIATDSGGVQKEAYFHQVPCVTLRDETEWTELVTLGWNRLVPPLSAGAVRDAIITSIGRKGQGATPYGDGRAAHRIAAILMQTTSC